jgi:hypothetical protein
LFEFARIFVQYLNEFKGIDYSGASLEQELLNTLETMFGVNVSA